MTSRLLTNEKTDSKKSDLAGGGGWVAEWLGVCSLESDYLGSHPRPAISWLCDTEQLASPFCASVSPCVRWDVSSCFMYQVVVAIKVLRTEPGMGQMIPAERVCFPGQLWKIRSTIMSKISHLSAAYLRYN